MLLSSLFAIAFFCLCIQAGIKDTLTFKIPNWMNITFVLLFIPAAFVSQIGWQTAGLHLLVGVVAFFLSYGLFAFNVFGGGDAKMIPGVLLWIGPAGVLHFLAGMALAGGLLTIALVIMRKAVPAHIAPGFAQPILSHKGVPYGVAIAAGAFFAAAKSPLLVEFINQLSGVY